MNKKQHAILPLLILILLIFCGGNIKAQVKWVNAESSFATFVNGFHVYKIIDTLEGNPFIAYYAIVDLKNNRLQFSTDTTYKRRLTQA